MKHKTKKPKAPKWLTRYRDSDDWFLISETTEKLDGHEGDYEVHDSFSEARRSILGHARAVIRRHRAAINEIRKLRAAATLNFPEKGVEAEQVTEPEFTE